MLSAAYCRSQTFLSQQMAQLRPELTMPMFSGNYRRCIIHRYYWNKLLHTISVTEITHRFQTARAEVRALLLRCLLPWLGNMELVASSVPPVTPLSYIMVSHNLFTQEHEDFARKKVRNTTLTYFMYSTVLPRFSESPKARRIRFNRGNRDDFK